MPVLPAYSYCANQFTDFYMRGNIGMKQVKKHLVGEYVVFTVRFPEIPPSTFKSLEMEYIPRLYLIILN